MRCICTVQQDQIPRDVRASLEAEVRRSAREALGPYAKTLQFIWIDVPAGSGYTAGKPSMSSLIGMTVPEGTDPGTREALLKAVCDGWSRITGCSANEVVVSAFDEGARPKIA